MPAIQNSHVTVYPLDCELMESYLCMLRNFFSPPWANLLPFCWSRLFSCFGTSRLVWTGGADRPDCPQSVPQAARVPANKPRKRRNVPAHAFTVIKGRLDWNCATCENTKKKSKSFSVQVMTWCIFRIYYYYHLLHCLLQHYFLLVNVLLSHFYNFTKELHTFFCLAHILGNINY